MLYTWKTQTSNWFFNWITSSRKSPRTKISSKRPGKTKENLKIAQKFKSFLSGFGCIYVIGANLLKMKLTKLCWRHRHHWQQNSKNLKCQNRHLRHKNNLLPLKKRNFRFKISVRQWRRKFSLKKNVFNFQWPFAKKILLSLNVVTTFIRLGGCTYVFLSNSKSNLTDTNLGKLFEKS